jgi:hypothetical protein
LAPANARARTTEVNANSWLLLFDTSLHPARTSWYGLDWLEAICTKHIQDIKRPPVFWGHTGLDESRPSEIIRFPTGRIQVEKWLLSNCHSRLQLGFTFTAGADEQTVNYMYPLPGNFSRHWYEFPKEQHPNQGALAWLCRLPRQLGYMGLPLLIIMLRRTFLCRTRFCF